MSAAVENMTPRIRPMRQTDIPAISGIERATYDFPWTETIFRDCLLAGYTNIVLEQNGVPVGYGVMSMAAGEAHLLNLCLVQALRGGGHGRNMLVHLVEGARQGGAERIYLEVRPSNKSALSLYRKMGFHVIGRRKDYYRAHIGREDAIVLVQQLFPDSES